MTVSAAYAPKSFSCNGVTKDFPFTFPIISETDLVVAVSTGAVKALQNLGQHYTVSINGTKGGTVSMLTAPASGTLTIERAVPILQPASIRNQKVFAPATIEDEMDRACMIDQQLQVQLDDQASDLEALQNLQLGSATVTALLTGSISGNVLTITAITGIVAPGMALSYLGSPAGLALQALGTGTGGTGTYILNQTLGTVGSQAMTAAGAGALVLLGILGALASSNAGLGDALMAVLAPYTGAVATTQRQVNSEMVSVFRFFTAAQIADVVARTCTLNLNSAMVNAVASGKRLFFPNGTYLWDQVSFPAGNIYWEGESMEGVVFRFSGAQPIGIKTGWVNNLNNHVILRNFSLDTSQLPALATSIGLQIQYCWGNHLENIKDHTVPGVGQPVLPANAYSLHVGFSVYTSLFDNMELQAIKVAGNSGSDASSCLVFNDWDGAYANLINLFSIKFQGGAVQNGQPNTYPAKFDFTGCVHVTLDTLDIEGSGLFLRYNGTNNFDINLVNCQLSPALCRTGSHVRHPELERQGDNDPNRNHRWKRPDRHRAFGHQPARLHPELPGSARRQHHLGRPGPHLHALPAEPGVHRRHRNLQLHPDDPELGRCRPGHRPGGHRRERDQRHHQQPGKRLPGSPGQCLQCHRHHRGGRADQHHHLCRLLPRKRNRAADGGGAVSPDVQLAGQPRAKDLPGGGRDHRRKRYPGPELPRVHPHRQPGVLQWVGAGGQRQLSDRGTHAHRDALPEPRTDRSGRHLSVRIEPRRRGRDRDRRLHHEQRQPALHPRLRCGQPGGARSVCPGWNRPLPFRPLSHWRGGPGLMAKRTEFPAKPATRADKMAERMAARVAGAARLAADYEQTLDPRQQAGRAEGD